MAGIIAAETNNEYGNLGITNIYDADNDSSFQVCEIIGINAGIINEGNQAISISVSKQIEGIEYAINNNVDVINMSFGGNAQFTARNEALAKAYNTGIILVAAAGNENSESLHYPSSLENVISVAALNTDGITKRTSSNYGDTLDISAPGTNIYNCSVKDSAMTTKSGTSMATPMVSAAAGMMRAVNKDLTPEEIEKILYATATDLYSSGWDKYTGYGRLNLGAAVKKAKLLKYAASNSNVDYSATCYYTGSNYSIYGMVTLNPAADKYIVYRAENSSSLGSPIMELGRNMITSKTEKDSNGNTITKKYIQFAQWGLSAGTYYYNIMALTLDGESIENKQMVVGNGVTSPFKIECNMSSNISMYMLNTPKNSLSISFNDNFDRFIVTRADNYAMSQNTRTFYVGGKTFTDYTGLIGKLYYYQTRAVKTLDHVTYYSNTSSPVYMLFQSS